MVDHDQVRPLAPATDRPISDEGQAAADTEKIKRRRCCIRCCGVATAILLINVIVIVILIFTVFHVKDPRIKLNGATITKLELVNGTKIPKAGVNISLIADISVKNPNVESFKYASTTTTLYYHGVVVGEAFGPPGRAKARRTMRMNLTVDIITDQLLASPNLTSDAASGLLTMDSYSKIPGRFKILKIIQRHVTVKMNCSMTVNITSQQFQSLNCKRKVDL